jgi:hypothetical protein
MAETPLRLACIEQADKSGPVPLEVGGSEAPGLTNADCSVAVPIIDSATEAFPLTPNTLMKLSWRAPQCASDLRGSGPPTSQSSR